MAEINWALGQGNGAQNAFQTGFQIGDMLRKRSEQRETKNALAGYIGTMGQGGVVATPEQQAASRAAEARLLAADPNTYLEARNQGFRQQQFQAQQQGAARKAQNEQIPIQINMLSAANPENWQSLRAEAIQRGFGTEQTLPVQFNQAWKEQQLGVLKSFQETPDFMTNDVKNVMAGLDPKDRDINSPVFQEAFRRNQERILTTPPGGSSLAYDSYGGGARPLVAPNPGNFVQGAPVGSQAAPETTKVIGGKQYYNYNGKWYDEPMGGGSGNATGGFR